jgi:glutamate racemase
VTVIDSSEEVAASLKHYLETHPEFARSLRKCGEKQFFVSDVTDAATLTAKKIFGRPIELTLV